MDASFTCVAAVNALFAPIAVVTNVLVLAAIWRNSSLRTPSYTFLAGLASTDFLTGLITQPAYTVYILGRIYSNEKKPHLTLTAIVTCNNVGRFLAAVTMVTIALMAVERWFHMSRRSFLTIRRICLIYAAVILLCILISVFQYHYFRYPDSEESIQRFFFPKLMGPLTAVCFAVTSFAYFKVFRIIRHQQLQIQANHSSQNFGQPTINLTKYKRSVSTIFFIMLLFWCTFLPQAICVCIKVAWLTTSVEVPNVVFHISATVLFLTSSLNPLLYCWRVKEIRDEVKLLTRKLTCNE